MRCRDQPAPNSRLWPSAESATLCIVPRPVELTPADNFKVIGANQAVHGGFVPFARNRDEDEAWKLSYVSEVRNRTWDRRETRKRRALRNLLRGRDRSSGLLSAQSRQLRILLRQVPFDLSMSSYLYEASGRLPPRPWPGTANSFRRAAEVAVDLLGLHPQVF